MSDSTQLFVNGVILASPEEEHSKYTWFLVESGKVKDIGDDDNCPDVAEFAQDHVHDLQGCRVLPGLIDSHLHVHLLGKQLLSYNASRCSIEELVETLGEYVQTQQHARQWIIGNGWEQDRLGRYPNRCDLDRVSLDRPIVLWRTCYHICVMNSKALEIVGITSTSVSPDGGVLDFMGNPNPIGDGDGDDDDDDANQIRIPSGILRENACSMVLPFLESDIETKVIELQAGLDECIRNGITCVQTNDAGCWEPYQLLVDRKQLQIRVQLTILYDEVVASTKDERKNTDTEEHDPKKHNPIQVPAPGEYYESLLSCDRVKLFADGSLGADTAALSCAYLNDDSPSSTESVHHKDSPTHKCAHDLSPPSTHSANRGVLIRTQDDMDQCVLDALSKGYRVEMHVIGDRAAESAILSFEKAFSHLRDSPSDPSIPTRNILTHCQILREDLMQRMLKCELIGNIQPQFVITDSRWIMEKVPADLMRTSYAWKTMLDMGIRVAGGSDAPVEIPSALSGIHAAIYRPTYSDPQHTSFTSWMPEQCLSKEQAFALYMSNGAYCGRREMDLGSLHVGNLADFIVLDTDVWKDPQLCTQAQVKQVWVNGQCIRRV